MKKASLLFIATVMVAMMCLSCGSNSGEVGQTASVNEVKIGNQVWMAENLNVEQFRNGDPIPHAQTDEEWQRAGEERKPAWCYYDNDPANGRKYGKLYNWYAATDPRGLAPEGWRIPSDEDWNELVSYLGERQVAGKKLKSRSGWAKNGNGTNESGFSGLPGGARIATGNFSGIGEGAYWWSSTDYDSQMFIWTRVVEHGNDRVTRGSTHMATGFSVRCLRDLEANP